VNTFATEYRPRYLLTNIAASVEYRYIYITTPRKNHKTEKIKKAESENESRGMKYE
jgi:hypothetical protein